ncbi:MAG: N-acetylglutaminylglutamine amidotransferase [Acidimicrobiales bacterium]
MCGISGELRFDGKAADVATVARMTDAQSSRGPDGTGVWGSRSVALGHRRLSIIDLSWRGHQPMVDRELGLTAVFNGCIYNHRELRAELEAAGHRFSSTSDTEVILKAYAAWGEACVERFAGMFAFAVVEHSGGAALLARDRLGIKPLYLARTPGRLRFASTLPALLAAGDVDTAVDPVALHHYLTFHAVVPEERTLLAGITRLPPATVMRVEADGHARSRRYWTLRVEEDPERAGRTPEEWAEEVEAALRRAVRRRLVADVPVGVLLSGGLDSSLITALVAEEGQGRLATFSIGFEPVGHEEGDEFRWSDVVAERYGTDHHRWRVPTAEVLDVLPAVIGAMSEPMVSHDVVAFYLLAEQVARDVKVVQSGQGADEVFAGYHWYATMAGENGDGPKSDGPRGDGPRDDGVERYASLFCDRTHDQVNAVVGPAYRVGDDPSRAFLAERFARPGATRAVDRALRLDTEVMLVEDPVKRVDNMTMAWGLEARVPFLDHELVELAGACPAPLKLASGGKGVLKDAARRVLPPEVIDRPKGYFPVPPLVQLQDAAVALLADALTDPVATRRGLFDPGHVEFLLAHPQTLTPLKYNQLWQLGVLELWLQAHGL